MLLSAWKLGPTLLREPGYTQASKPIVKLSMNKLYHGLTRGMLFYDFLYFHMSL
jgi:hypothetical protein